MAAIGILGAGSWGTALAILLCNNGHEVTLWSHRREEAEALKAARMHTSKLPGVIIPGAISITSELENALEQKDVLVMAVPSSQIRSTSRKIRPWIHSGQIILDVAKGIEETTFATMTEIISEEIPGADAAVLSGPSHAEEVGRAIPTICVIGAKTEKTAKYLQNIFMSPVFRVYISPDMMGIELGGALKNVIALAAGIADGLGYGDNTKAALITRGIAEIARLGAKLGGRQETFAGLTGIGDLIVTCASIHSRNRKAGVLIGQGRSMDEAMKEVNMVVEGVYSTKAAVGLAAKYDVEIPIIQQVDEILFKGKSPKDAVNNLMLRDKKIENPLLPW
ncbi:MAG: NAD(P)H-dependent glycerol-3-phosphate dehydrogenase [Lachnospiraceae bacterium]|nr:NAD(P)H-dependent glycerol-3-phosphate dehydrogenase [Lachnospiraceae bacterium]